MSDHKRDAMHLVQRLSDGGGVSPSEQRQLAALLKQLAAENERLGAVVKDVVLVARRADKALTSLIQRAETAERERDEQQRHYLEQAALSASVRQSAEATQAKLSTATGLLRQLREAGRSSAFPGWGPAIRRAVRGLYNPSLPRCSRCFTYTPGYYGRTCPRRDCGGRSQAQARP